MKQYFALLLCWALPLVSGFLPPMVRISSSSSSGRIASSFEHVDALRASSTPQKPLYDGTNYTFPDTTSPDGIAGVLEVSFVHACMQLSGGYVDVLKMFIATSVSSYQMGFTLEEVQNALANCETETANRPLMPEEIQLRQAWLSIVYLTLSKMNHATVNKGGVQASIPADLKDTYGDMVEQILNHPSNSGQDASSGDAPVEPLSIESLIAQEEATSGTDRSPMEKAIMTQSLRVALLTPTVVQEALEAGGSVAPPTPPIEGAFE